MAISSLRILAALVVLVFVCVLKVESYRVGRQSLKHAELFAIKKSSRYHFHTHQVFILLTSKSFV